MANLAVDLAGGGGGGGGVVAGIWSPDVPPLVPSAFDDEFNDGAIDAKWTQWDPGAYTTFAQGDGHLRLEQAGDGTIRYAGLFQAIPAGGEFACYARVGIVGAAGQVGLFVGGDLAAAPSTTPFRVVEYQSSSTLGAVNTVVARTWPTYNGSPSASQLVSCAGSAGGWVRARVNGTTVATDYSKDGVSWDQIDSQVVAFTPTTMGVHAMIQNSGVTQWGLVDYFRVFAGVGTSGMQDTKIGGFLNAA